MNKGETVKIRDTKGVYRTVHQKDIIETARECITKKLKRETILTSASQARHYVQMMLGVIEQEIILMIFLDSQHRVIEAKEMFYGMIDGASVYPREVVKAALGYNAAAVIFAPPKRYSRSVTSRYPHHRAPRIRAGAGRYTGAGSPDHRGNPSFYGRAGAFIVPFCAIWRFNWYIHHKNCG